MRQSAGNKGEWRTVFFFGLCRALCPEGRFFRFFFSSPLRRDAEFPGKALQGRAAFLPPGLKLRHCGAGAFLKAAFFLHPGRAVHGRPR